MARYRILWHGVGRLMFDDTQIRNAKEYSDPRRIPVFNEITAPITSGIRALEKRGELEIEFINATRREVGIEQPAFTQPELPFGGESDEAPDTNESSGAEASVNIDAPSVSETPTTEETEPDAPSGPVEEPQPNRLPDKDPNSVPPHQRFTQEIHSEEALVRMTLAELDDICRARDIRGFSTRDRDGKVGLILKAQEEAQSEE